MTQRLLLHCCLCFVCQTQTPLLLLDVLLLAAVPVGTALWVVFADILMILFGLFGAITSHHYRCAGLTDGVPHLQ